MPTIFICDDEAEILRYLEKLLQASGYLVETFSHGKDLLMRLENAAVMPCDVILQDVRMPDLDVIERAVILARSGIITLGLLPLVARREAPSVPSAAAPLVALDEDRAAAHYVDPERDRLPQKPRGRHPGNLTQNTGSQDCRIRTVMKRLRSSIRARLTVATLLPLRQPPGRGVAHG